MADEQSEYDVASLRVTRTEARAVLDRQIEDLGDIDDKAAQTLRFNILLGGVVLTVASLLVGSEVTPTVTTVANPPVVAGVVTSGISMVTAIWAYTNTSYRVGTGSMDIRRFLLATPPEDEWLATLLCNYAAWIETNAKRNRRDGFALFVSHAFFALSLGYYGGGVVYGLYVHPLRWWVAMLVVFGYGVGLGSLVLGTPYRSTGRLFARIRDKIGDFT